MLVCMWLCNLVKCVSDVNEVVKNIDVANGVHLWYRDWTLIEPSTCTWSLDNVKQCVPQACGTNITRLWRVFCSSSSTKDGQMDTKTGIQWCWQMFWLLPKKLDWSGYCLVDWTTLYKNVWLIRLVVYY